MPTSVDLREGSRIAVATARALGATDHMRGRQLAAHGLALALRAEQIERAAAKHRNALLERMVITRRSPTLSAPTQITRDVATTI